MELPLRKIIDFAMSKPAEVDKAYQEFFGNLPPTEMENEWEQLFLEWLIYDYRQSNGSSFIAEYVLRNPDNYTEEKLDEFKQVAETHFYSNFEIAQIRRGKWLKLEDLFTGKIYKVYERKGSETIADKGIIPGRIAKINNCWYLVGANSVYFPLTHTNRAKKFMQKLEIKNFSPRDIVELLRQQSQNMSSPPVLTKEEIASKKKEIKTRYQKQAKKYSVSLSIDELIDEIYNEERVNIIDFWRGLVEKGLTEEFIIKQHQILQDLWNYFPHKCLKGLSPVEMFAKYKKQRG